jgi:DNA polymerase-3 subunit epsilon
MSTEPLRNASQVNEQCGLAAFIDVETTGLSTRSDEVVELAIALFAFDRTTGDIKGVVEEYSGLRDPGRPIPAEATRVHGIRDCDVRGKCLDDGQVLKLINQAEFLVAHNASYDRPFVERLYPETAGKTWLCSMNGVPWRQKGFESRALQSLLSDHGIRPEKAHRGLSDVRSALQLLSCTDGDGVCYFRYLLDRQSDRSGDRESTARVSAARAARTTSTARATGTSKATKAPLTPRASEGDRVVAPARESRGLAGLVSLPFRAAWKLVKAPFVLVQRACRRSQQH